MCGTGRLTLRPGTVWANFPVLNPSQKLSRLRAGLMPFSLVGLIGSQTCYQCDSGTMHCTSVIVNKKIPSAVPTERLFTLTASSAWPPKSVLLSLPSSLTCCLLLFGALTCNPPPKLLSSSYAKLFFALYHLNESNYPQRAHINH